MASTFGEIETLLNKGDAMKLVLTGEQNRVLTLPCDAPIQIKGVAGSGKTTVAVYRARHVAASFGDMLRGAKVQIFSYNKNIVKYIRKFLSSERERSIIKVSTVHSWAYQYLKRTGRGTQDRVTAADRELLWDIFTQYCQEIERNRLDQCDDQ
ncbi:MAG: hypothetical protein R6V06_01420 [Kiritimatiellia bacterium]